MEYVFKHKCDDLNSNLDESDVAKLKNINSDLNVLLTSWKNKINNNHYWDIHKAFTNNYEFIYSSNETIVKKKPISRSYFKLWEILHDFGIFCDPEKIVKNTAHLAEGPGGFIECCCDYFATYGYTCEKISGITLKSCDSKIPNWKVSRKCIDLFNIHLNTKEDGNMYNIKVIQNFIYRSGKNSCHFVTADGGFDFSSDFNNQEQQSILLLMCEIYTAVNIQRAEGHFLLKVFDIFSTQSITLIAACSIFYKEMNIIKPKTSRPGNSEKYILFVSRNYTDDPFKRAAQADVLSSLYEGICKKTTNEVKLPHKVYITVLNKITEYNIYYTLKQIAYIKKTLSFDNKNVKDVIQTNLKLCTQWCQEYNLETNKHV